MKSKMLKILSIASLGIVFIGCSGKEVVLEQVPPKNYEVIGQAKGTGNGSLGVIATAYNFIPMGLNTRVESAYDDALNSVEGASGLINVTLQEDWFWWLIGTNRKVTITGDAIKETNQ